MPEAHASRLDTLPEQQYAGNEESKSSTCDKLACGRVTEVPEDWMQTAVSFCVCCMRPCCAQLEARAKKVVSINHPNTKESDENGICKDK